MSDGDNATPGPVIRPDPGPKGDNKWLTRTPRADARRRAVGAAADTAGPDEPGPTVAVDRQPHRRRHRRRPVRQGHRRDPGGAAAARPAPHRRSAQPAHRQAGRRRPADDPRARRPTRRRLPTRSAATAADCRGHPGPRHRSNRRPRSGRPGTHRIRRRSRGSADPMPAEAPPQPMLPAGRVAALMAVLALVLTGGAWQWTTTKNNRLNNVAALDPNSRDIVDPNAQFGDENFLIVGVDSRLGENSDMGAGNTEDAGGARSDTVMLVNIPADRKRVVAVSFPRDLAITPMKCEAWDARHRPVRPGLRRGDRNLRSRRGLHRDQAELGLRVRRPEMPGQGDPEDLRPVDQPLHGDRLRRLRQDGRRPRRRRGVQHHPARGLRTRHRAGQRRTPDDRRAHRAQLRPGPPGHHRGQRRLRPHQAPAAVPVLAAAFADLQGHLLLAEQAQQRRQHVHQRQLRRQHQDQGSRRPRPVDAGRVRRPHHVRHRAHPGITDEDGNEAPAHRRHARAVRRDHQRRSAARRERPERDHHPGDQHVSSHRDHQVDRPAKPPPRRPEPRCHHRTGRRGDHRPRRTSPCTCRTRPARPGWARRPAPNCSSTASTSTRPDDYSELAVRRPRCCTPPATSRRPRPWPRRSAVRTSSG